MSGKNVFRPVVRGKAEAFLARLAARFPGLVDPDCERAGEALESSDPGDLGRFLIAEFSTMAASPQNVDKRLIELARDRARKGIPGRCQA